MVTTTTTEFFSPGKLFVLGEWSVLDGAPAVLIPAPGGQRGTARATGTAGEFLYTSPGFTSGGAIDVVGCTEKACREAFGDPPRGLALHVESEGLRHEGCKLGFGSSGSVAALVAHAWAWACDVDDRPAVRDTALVGHWDAQGGRGSGADVALSAMLTGPVTPRSSVTFQRARAGAVACEEHAVPVYITAVWTGRAADTRVLIDAVRASAQSPAILSSLAAVSDAGASAWVRGDAKGVLQAATAARETLRALGVAAGADIVTVEHDRISQVAGDEVVSKPSGAGGGDMALVMAEDSGAMDRAEARLIEAGYLIFARLPK